MNEQLQIITEEYELNGDLNKSLEKWEEKNFKNYFVVGIIGGQSSGKSTLLNNIFDTNFSTMQSQIHRGQTTKGIWSNYDKKNNILIFDIEGSDSKERWDQKETIEKSTALFGLVLSNILIINIWLHDVGRFSSSNYNILKTIMEINLKLFEKETPKKIMFVIRDFNDNENFDKIKEEIKSDVIKLWNEIDKPNEIKNIEMDKIIKLEFARIRSLVYEKEKFNKDCEDLKSRFVNKLDVNYLFNNLDQNKNSLFGDLPILMKRVFDLIKNNKEINLPNQKDMISNFRCQESKNLSLEFLENKINELKEFLIKNPSNGSEYIKNITDEALNIYNKDTINYDLTIVNNIKNELLSQINLKLDDIFKSINSNKIKEIINWLNEKIKLSTNDSNILKICQDIKKNKNESINNYQDFLKPFCQNDDKKFNYFFKNFKNQIEMKVYEIISSKLNYFLKKIQNNKYKELENISKRFFKTFDNENYLIFNNNFIKIFKDYENDVESLKLELKEIESLIKEDYLLELKKELFLLVKSQLVKNINQSHKFLIEIFKKKFENDDNGMRRNWKKINDNEIEDLFKMIKNEMKDNLELIKNFKIPQIEDSNLNNDLTNNNLLNEDEIIIVNEKFDEGVNSILEKAFNKKYDRNSFDRIPKWLWAVLAFAIHDNILNMISNPMVLFLVILLSVGIGYLFATGKIHILFTMINLVKTMFLGKKDDPKEKKKYQ